MDRDGEREELLDRMINLENWEDRIFGTVCGRLAENKINFERDIKDLFRPFRESETQQNIFDWGCVKGIYNNVKYVVNRIWKLRICCAYVLELFCMYNCEDHSLMAKVIHIYHQVLNEYENGISFLALCPNCTQLNYPRHHYFEELKGTSSILCTVNGITGRTYMFTNSELYSKLTVRALDEGDYVFLKFLVKYGLSYYPDDELLEANAQLKRLKNAYERLKRIENYDNGERKFAASVIVQLLTDEEKTRRLILIMRYANICLRRRLRDTYYKDYVDCLKLYVLTLPEAVISVKDVEDFLNLAFPNDIDFIKLMCLDFQKEVFKDSPSLSSPRSLKHLCRCTVRDSIQRSSLLPSVLSEIPIPKKIKEYLLILSN